MRIHDERKREVFGLAREKGSDGGAPSIMEKGVGKLSCQARELVCVEVKREGPQALHESYVYFSL